MLRYWGNEGNINFLNKSQKALSKAGAAKFIKNKVEKLKYKTLSISYISEWTKRILDGWVAAQE